jgi:hypothetical protein
MLQGTIGLSAQQYLATGYATIAETIIFNNNPIIKFS